MSTRFDSEDAAFDFKNAAFAVITGNASGVTPMLSGWIRVINVDSIAFALTTAASTNGVWTAEVAQDYLGASAIPVASRYVSPAFPTGVNQSATPVITIPNRMYTHIRLTFTPSAGSGAVLANTGTITGRGVDIRRHGKGVGVHMYAPDTQAGQFSIDYSPTFYDRDIGQEGVPQIDNLADPQVWFPAIDSANSAVSIAATTAGVSVAKRLGLLEFASIRVKFLPTSGAGRARAIVNAKG